MSVKIALLVLIVAATILYGCAALQEFVQKPTVAFERMSLKDMSLFEGTLLFDFKVTNPNPIGTKVSRVVYNLKINDREFLEGSSEKDIAVIANGSNSVELPVTVRYFDLFQSVMEFIQSDKVAYDLSGSIGIGPFDVPYHTAGDLNIPKLPKLSLKRAEVSGFSFTGASVIFSLELENENPFMVNLSGLNFGIKLGGIDFLESSSANISSIGEGSKSTLEVPVNISFLKLGRSAYELLTDSSSGYELTGEMRFDLPRIGEKSFPFQKIGEVPFYK